MRAQAQAEIAINAGEDGSVIVGKILEKDQYSYGFDAQNNEYSTRSKLCGPRCRNAASNRPARFR